MFGGMGTQFGELGLGGNVGQAGGGGSAPARRYASNGLLLPYSTTTSTARVIHCRKRRRFALNANWSALELSYAWFTSSSVGEVASYGNCRIRAGVEYAGLFYPVLFSGVRDTVIGGAVTAKGSCTLNGTAGDYFFEVVRITLPLLFKTQTVNFQVGETVTGATSGATGVILSQTDAGTTGALILSSETGTFQNNEALTGNMGGVAVVDLATAQPLPFCISSQIQWYEGIKSTNNSAEDYTIAAGATNPVFTCTTSGGSINGNTKVFAGTGWSTAPNVVAWEVQADGRVAQKVCGYGNLDGGGGIANISIYDPAPPAGVSWVSPTLSITGGTGPGSNFGTTTAIYCASKITGIASVSTAKSLLVIGDSLRRGDGATDASGSGFSGGDVYNNFGLTERPLANRCGMANMSTPGGKASYYVQNVSLYPLTYAFYFGESPPTHVEIGLGTNDIADGDTEANVTANVNAIKTLCKSYGSLVTVSDILPRTTGTFTSEAGQTAVAGFTSGAARDTFNTKVSNGTIVVDWNAIRPALKFNGTDTTKWAAPSGVAQTAEGIHQSQIGWANAGSDTTMKSKYAGLA